MIRNLGGWTSTKLPLPSIWGFPKMGVPQYGWFIMDNAIPPVQETPYWYQIPKILIHSPSVVSLHLRLLRIARIIVRKKVLNGETEISISPVWDRRFCWCIVWTCIIIQFLVLSNVDPRELAYFTFRNLEFSVFLWSTRAENRVGANSRSEDKPLCGGQLKDCHPLFCPFLYHFPIPKRQFLGNTCRFCRLHPYISL